MVAPVFKPNALAGMTSEFIERPWRHDFIHRILKHSLGTRGIGLGLITNSFEAFDAVLQCRVIQVGDACFNGIVKALEAGFGIRRALVQFGDVFTLTRGSLLMSVEHSTENRFQPLWPKQARFKVGGYEVIQLLHRHGHALTGGWPLPGFH